MSIKLYIPKGILSISYYKYTYSQSKCYNLEATISKRKGILMLTNTNAITLYPYKYRYYEPILIQLHQFLVSWWYKDMNSSYKNTHSVVLIQIYNALIILKMF